MVASEDKLLFAAQIHAAKLVVSGFTSQLAVAAGQVGTLGRPLVCCPHLSRFWLSASVLSGEADKLLLRRLQPQLQRLLIPARRAGLGEHLGSWNV